MRRYGDSLISIQETLKGHSDLVFKEAFQRLGSAHISDEDAFANRHIKKCNASTDTIIATLNVVTDIGNINILNMDIYFR